MGFNSNNQLNYSTHSYISDDFTNFGEFEPLTTPLRHSDTAGKTRNYILTSPETHSLTENPKINNIP